MKTLQNNFTTPEQSRRLWEELDVPADSADCIYPCYIQYGEGDKQIMYGHINVKHPAMSYPKSFIPCWSVGRLIEIFLLCTPYKEISLHGENLVEQMAVSIFMARKDNLIDFSKLEECKQALEDAIKEEVKLNKF